MKSHPLIAAVAALALAPASFAHAAGDPKPASELSQLTVFVGTWKCTGNQHDSIFGPAHPIQTTAIGKSDLNGFWISVRYQETKTKANDHPTAGVFQYGYDPAGKQYIANWTDSLGGYGQQTAKSWDGDKLVLVGDYNSGGQKIAARDTFTKKDSRTLTHVAELQAAGNWVVLQDETCRK